jgi:hypothetical protein
MKAIRIIREIPLGAWAVIIVLGLLIFVIIDKSFAKPQKVEGVILGKHHKAEIDTRGSGVGITTSGSPVFVSTGKREPAEYHLIVRTVKGEIITCECTVVLYALKKEKDEVTCNVYKGLFTERITDIWAVN